jgi:CIC family chloride channel protein
VLSRRLAVTCALPALIGVVTGACVAGFAWLIEGHALGLLASLPGWFPALLSPLALLLTLGVTQFITRTSTPATAELYIETYHQPGARLPLRQLPGRLLAACTTVAFGGSQGLESPSALLGASFGDVLGHARGWLREDERRSLMVAGASAGIAAVFSSPGVGMLYGMEVPFRRDVDAPRLVPAAVAAACAYAVRVVLVGSSDVVALGGTPIVDLTLTAGALAVAIASGLAARIFAALHEGLRRLAQRGRPFWRAALAGLVLAGLAFLAWRLTGRWITFGPGYVASAWLFAAPHALMLLAAVLVVRTFGTLICVYGGGGGGVFTSLALTGAFVGEMVSRAFGRSDPALAVIGAACVLGAGYRIPLACMLFVAEAGGGVLFSLLGFGAVALSQTFMGEASVSDAQRDTRAEDARQPP